MPLGGRLRVRTPPSRFWIRRANHTASFGGRRDLQSEGPNPRRPAPPGACQLLTARPPPLFSLDLPGGSCGLRPGVRQPRRVGSGSAAILTAAAETRLKPSRSSRSHRLCCRGVSPPSLAARALRARDRKSQGGPPGHVTASPAAMTPSASSRPPPPIPACFVSPLRSRVARSSRDSVWPAVLPRDHPVLVGGASSARGGFSSAGRRERNRYRGRRGREHARGGAWPSRDKEVPLTALPGVPGAPG